MAAEPSYNAAFFAKLFRLTERRIQQMAREGIIPKSGRGKYPLLGTIQGYVDELRRQAEGSQEFIDYRAERARRERAAADKLEFDLAKERRHYVHTSHIKDLLARFAGQASAIFQAAPSRIKNRIPNLKPRELTIIKRELAGVSNAIADLRPD